jgi:hypothetical protein
MSVDGKGTDWGAASWGVAAASVPLVSSASCSALISGRGADGVMVIEETGASAAVSTLTGDDSASALNDFNV